MDAPQNPPPSGFTPQGLTSWNRYFVPQADTNAYRVGDVVKSAGGTDAAGIVAVTLCTGVGAVRGVVVAVDPGLPATGGLIGAKRLSVPAVKSRGYYLWVDDDPSRVFAVIDDAQVSGNRVPGSVGAYANFTLGAGAAINGGSTAALSSSTLGSSAGCLQVLSLQAGSTYSPGATWLVKFAMHELADGVPSGGVGGPVTVIGTPGVGNTLTAVLATGWTATGYQWKRDGTPISGATSTTYTLVTADAGHLITLTVSGLVYTPTGVTVPPVTVNVWDDTQTWNDSATWTD